MKIRLGEVEKLDNKTLFITEGFQRVIDKVAVSIAGLPIPISALK